MEKLVIKRNLKSSTDKDDLEYWLSRSPEERVSAVEFLRRQYHGSSARLQRSVRVIQRKKS